MITFRLKLFLACLFISTEAVLAQPVCPTSGTVSANCLTTGNLTINGSTLTVNAGVTMQVTGNLFVVNGGIINGTGATFTLGNLTEGYGSTNTINGGTYNIGAFSSGGGGNFTMTGASINISPAGAVALAGNALVVNSSTFTGVTNWSVNVTSLAMNGTSVTASGSIQLEDATVSNGTFIAGTSFSTTNGTNTISNSVITAGTTASVKNTSFTNSSLDVEGLLTIQSGNVSFDNSTINSGKGNAGTNDADALTMNGGGILTLTGGSAMNVRGSVTNNEWYIDNSTVTVTGDFDNAGSEILEVRNNGSINVNGDFNNSGSGSVSADSGGFVGVAGDYNNNGGGSTDVNGGTLLVGGTYSGGAPTGDAGSCSGGSGGCCGSGCAALPVSLLEFKGNYQDGRIQLSWSTASEIDNDFFEVERSFDGVNFDKIATVNGNGTSTEKLNYELYVGNVIASASTQYFRLSQTDFDGTHVKLMIIAVHKNKITSVSRIYPNPAKGEIAFSLADDSSIAGSIFDLSGALILQFSSPRVEVAGLKRGTYLVEWTINGERQTERLIVQ